MMKNTLRKARFYDSLESTFDFYHFEYTLHAVSPVSLFSNSSLTFSANQAKYCSPCTTVSRLCDQSPSPSLNEEKGNYICRITRSSHTNARSHSPYHARSITQATIDVRITHCQVNAGKGSYN